MSRCGPRSHLAHKAGTLVPRTARPPTGTPPAPSARSGKRDRSAIGNVGKQKSRLTSLPLSPLPLSFRTSRALGFPALRKAEGSAGRGGAHSRPGDLGSADRRSPARPLKRPLARISALAPGRGRAGESKRKSESGTGAKKRKRDRYAMGFLKRKRDRYAMGFLGSGLLGVRPI